MFAGRGGESSYQLLATFMRGPFRIANHDVTGGFKIWRRETLLGMPLDRICSNGYAFQIEMAYVAYRLGYTFHEVPFYFADRRRGNSKMSFQIQKEAALRVWEMRYKYRQMIPPAAFQIR